MQIGAIALEERMGADRQENIEIARRPAAHARFAFAGEPDAGAVLDAGRDVHRQRTLAGDTAGAGAGRTRAVDRLAAALALRAGALEREETLGVADFALALAHRANFWLGAWLGAGAGAGLAGDRGRDTNLRRLARIGLVQGDFHVVAQIGAALAAGATATAAAAHAEQIV